MGRETRATWAKRVERWKASGRAADDFAAELGVSTSSLKWWKWRLGSEARAALAKPPTVRKSSAALAKRTADVSPLTFVEMTTTLLGEPLEVVLPTTIRVRVPNGFDGTTLVRLLDVLERRR